MDRINARNADYILFETQVAYERKVKKITRQEEIGKSEITIKSLPANKYLLTLYINILGQKRLMHAKIFKTQTYANVCYAELRKRLIFDPDYYMTLIKRA